MSTFLRCFDRKSTDRSRLGNGEIPHGQFSHFNPVWVHSSSNIFVDPLIFLGRGGGDPSLVPDQLHVSLSSF